LSLVEVTSNSTQTSKEETANQTINIMQGLKEYLQNSDCSKCRNQLRKIFFIEDKIVAGPSGDKPAGQQDSRYNPGDLHGI
jgi:hypothetical protein